MLAVVMNTGLLAIAFLLPKKLLTPLGYLNAWVLGVLLWGAVGWQAFAVTMAYFAVGTAVTKVGFAQKEAAGIAEARGGVRGPGNVWGSALVAAVCALLVLVVTLTGNGASAWIGWLVLGLVASLATKLSDTSATEIGKAYGQRTFLITTLKPVPRGTEGAVSLEGTLAGAVGSILLATFAWGIGLIAPVGILICAIAAFIATNIESLIGATIEGKIPGLTHDVVNIINTLIGAGVAVGVAWLVGY
ncbi:MAG: TIGR00297 family protein [Cyanobacteria bacterium P01_F01_bin.4]